jgi:tetratricopeptide (TPR) repeat protein
MRQFHVLLADNLIRNGEKGKALDILNKAVVEFPNSKIPYDRYDIMLAENYFKAGNTAKAKEVLNEIIDYYTEYLNYYNRFTGRKARSVEGEKQLSLLTLSEILSIAERYGMQQEAAKLKQIPEVAQVNRVNQVGRLLNDYIERLNAGANAAQQGNTAKAEELFIGLIEDIKANLLNSGDEQIDNQVGSMLAYIVSVSNKLGLSSVIEKIQNDAQLLSMAKQASELIAAQQ